MRLLRLDLTAYGPFTKTSLDLSSPGLQVLYGANEAGKSTVLRAVVGLLYGIEAQTGDDHVHKKADLRIGARLARGNGEELEIVRRKGNKDTLLGPDGAPLSDAVLAPFLGAVSEAAFTSMFGLDHARLRSGGEALAKGEGDVGESLFGAGLEPGRLRAVLDGLEAEARELFAPRRGEASINAAIDGLKAAAKVTRESGISTRDFEERQAAAEAAEKQRAELLEKIAKLRARVNALERARRALPHLARRTQLRSERAEMGDVTLLAPGAGDARARALNDQRQAEIKAAALQRELSDLVVEHAALVVPEALLSRGAEIKQLTDRLGGHRTAAKDLPRLLAELRSKEEAAEGVLRQLGRKTPLSEVETLRIDAARQALVRKLAGERPALEEKLRGTRVAIAERDGAIRATVQKLEALPVPCDVEVLRQALARAQREGDLERTLAAEQAKVDKLRASASAAQSALGLWDGPIEEAPRSPVPSAETVSIAAEHKAGLDLKRTNLDEQAEKIGEDRVRTNRQIDELQGAGEVPTEEGLRMARERRETAWRLVRRAWLQQEDVAEETRKLDSDVRLEDIHEEATLRADTLADRLRREAERVTRRATLVAELQEQRTREERLARGRAEVDAALADAEATWRRLWEPSGVAPLAPAQMLGWLTRFEHLRGQARALGEATQQCDHLRATIDEHRAAIAAGAAELGRPAPPAGQRLAASIAREQAFVASMDETASERARLSKSVETLAADRERLESQAAEEETALTAWRASWAAAVAPLGLAAGATGEEATAVLDQLVELFRFVAQAAELRKRANGIKLDASAFAAEVAQLVKDHAPERAQEAPDLVADALIERYNNGKVDLGKRQALDTAIAAKRREQAETTDRAMDAGQRLAALLAAAQCTDLALMEGLEQRSEQARALDSEIAACEGKLLAAGEGASLPSLESQAVGLDVDLVSSELQSLAGEVVGLEQKLNAVTEELGRARGELERMDGRDAAALAAADGQACLARIRVDADRYLRLRLAASILSRAVERYREQNQGPLLARASALFAQLTLGRYDRLHGAYDDRDKVVLRCVRDGQDVGLDGLSDGASDQLFLALRLASMERYIERSEPVPVVMDDIFINFDDERARMGLAALIKLAARTQVLLFTHHSRIAELARGLVPTQATVHEIGDNHLALAAAG